MWVSGRATYKQNNHEHWQANSNDSQLNSSNHRRQAQLNNSWKSIWGPAWSTQTTSESWELLLMEKILTPVDMVNIPLFTRFEKIPSGAGFLPSTVSTTNCVSIAATALKQSTIVLLNKNMTRKVLPLAQKHHKFQPWAKFSPFGTFVGSMRKPPW